MSAGRRAQDAGRRTHGRRAQDAWTQRIDFARSAATRSLQPHHHNKQATSIVMFQARPFGFGATNPAFGGTGKMIDMHLTE